MSVLGLSRRDIEKAVRQYYSDYENDLFKQFDFDHFELYVDKQRQGYTGVEFTVPERTHEALPSADGQDLAENPDAKQ